MTARLEKARWAGGPKICSEANLPAFVDEASMRAFHKANGPSCKVLKEWECAACGHWHMKTLAPDPAGASSGNGRSSKFDYQPLAAIAGGNGHGDARDLGDCDSLPAVSAGVPSETTEEML